jgi:hypothetical protein
LEKKMAAAVKEAQQRGVVLSRSAWVTVGKESKIHMHHNSAEFRGRTARGKALNFVRDYIESTMYELMEFTGHEAR